MEILKIGKQAVKVSLNVQETIKYKITTTEELSEAEIKENFSLLLNEIKKKTDFSYANKKIFTEIFPSKDGGCEIYISCIGTEADNIVYKEKSTETDTKKKLTPSIYVFDGIEELLNVSYRLNEIKHSRKSSIFYDNEKNRYFLILEDINVKNIKYAFLLEYAKYIKGSVHVFLKEHYKCLINKDAIKVLSSLT